MDSCKTIRLLLLGMLVCLGTTSCKPLDSQAMTEKTRRGLAALGRNQKFVEWKKHHNVLCIKMLQMLKIRIEHGKQRSAGL